VLSTTKNPANANEYIYDVHFWLGSDCSQDEAGTAAYKTVELDDVLHGKATQHREVEGAESELFKSYFQAQGGLRLMKGGIESGFHHVPPHEYRPRLLIIYGKHNITVKEVPLARASLNQGDAFVLDEGMVLYDFQGSKASGQQRVRAGQLIKTISDERGGKPRCVTVSETDDADKDADASQFWKHLGGFGPISGPVPEPDVKPVSNKLLQVVDGGVQKLKEGPVRKSDLQSTEAYILDVTAEVFVWVGAKASPAHKKGALGLAQKYLADAGLPNYTSLCRVIEVGENAVFTSYLAGEVRPFTYAHPHTTGIVPAGTPAAAAAHHWAPVATHTVVH